MKQRMETGHKKALWTGLSLLGVFFAAIFSISTGSAQDSSQEDKVKAAFIYQFTNYIEWADGAGLKKPSDHFVIEVLGHSSLHNELLNLAKSKTVKGHAIDVIVAEDVTRLTPAPMVIITTGDEATLTKAAGKLKNTPSLIVAEGPDFAKKGAMINFFIEKDRLRFEINRTAMTNAKLTVGSQLLALARVVE
jgi:hypothetical protein